MREDDLASCPNRFEEQIETASYGSNISGLAFKYQVAFDLRPRLLNEEPKNRRCGEEYRGYDERIVVPEMRDQRESCAERSCRPRNFVKDVNKRVHTSQLLDIAAYKVSGDDSADELDHTVDDTAYADYVLSAHEHLLY